MAPPLNVNQFIIEPTLGNFTIILLFLAPMITMRLFAEEQRQGTIELLLTSPVTDYEIILGKWLGAMLLYVCMLAVSAINFAVLFYFTSRTGSARRWLSGACCWWAARCWRSGRSSRRSRRIRSWPARSPSASPAAVGARLGEPVLDLDVGRDLLLHRLPAALAQFTKGVLELKDVVYYVSVIVLGLFLSKRSLESIRWKA